MVPGVGRMVPGVDKWISQGMLAACLKRAESTYPGPFGRMVPGVDKWISQGMLAACLKRAESTSLQSQATGGIPFGRGVRSRLVDFPRFTFGTDLYLLHVFIGKSARVLRQAR